MEKSDVIVLVLDSRHPLFHIPAGFIPYVVDELKKPLVLVLTKRDLLTERLAESWKAYLKGKFSGIEVVTFGCFAYREDILDDITLGTSLID